MEDIFKFLIIIAAGGIAGGLVGFCIDIIHAMRKYYMNRYWVTCVPYARLVRETIYFTGGILAEKGIRYYPSFTLRYYRHSKYAGVFNGEVVIYLKSNSDIPELVDTVLHEVQHYIQSRTDRHYKLYGRYTAERGYRDNPFEIECRAFAARHRDECLKYLESKQLIKRA